MFIGYPSGYKGYRLYDLTKKVVFISRDVVFHENVFPFQSNTPQTPVIDPFPDVVLPKPLPDTAVPHYPIPSLHPDSAPAAVSDATPIPPLAADVPVLRRSTRSHRPPTYLQNYHCNQVAATSCSYPISDYLSYQKLSPLYHQFVMQVSSIFEPQFYHQAAPIPEWQDAMKLELQAKQMTPGLSFPYLRTNTPLDAGGFTRSNTTLMGLWTNTKPA